MPFGEVPDEGDGKQGENGVDPGGNGETGASRPVPDDARLDARAVADLCGRFEAEHLARYGHAFSGEFPVEIVNLRLVGTRRPAGTVEPARFDPASHAGPDERRNVYFGPAAGLVETPVIGRGRLGAEPCPGPHDHRRVRRYLRRATGLLGGPGRPRQRCHRAAGGPRRRQVVNGRWTDSIAGGGGGRTPVSARAEIVANMTSFGRIRGSMAWNHRGTMRPNVRFGGACSVTRPIRMERDSA